MKRRVGIVSKSGGFIVVWAMLACGPGTGGSGTTASTSDTTQSGSTGPTATGVTPGVTSSTTTADSTATSVGPSTTSGPDVGGGPVVECADEPPARVPDPPPGCEHVYLLDSVGQPDLSRPSGYWSCGDDFGAAIYRVAAVACNCDYQHPPCADGTPEDCGSVGACGPGESCLDFFGHGFCSCEAPCTQDSECQPGEICLCAARRPKFGRISSTNRCVPADCVDDGECPGDLHCKIDEDICYQSESLRCTTPADDCATHADCMTQYCHWDEVEELWTCDQGAICE